jgi:hypothetical protein
MWLRTLLKCLRLRLQSDEGGALLPEPLVPPQDDARRRSGMPLLLSEEQLAVCHPASGPDDMHSWMRDEDERREKIFALAHESPRPSKARRRVAGARSARSPEQVNASYQMARQRVKHVYCCGACGARLSSQPHPLRRPAVRRRPTHAFCWGVHVLVQARGSCVPRTC